MYYAHYALLFIEIYLIPYFIVISAFRVNEIIKALLKLHSFENFP